MKNINKLLSCYHFFNTKEEALEYAKERRWRKYNLSCSRSGNCWTLYHKER